MTDRTHYDCEEARAHYHQVRRGDVTIAELDRYDEHLASCDACQAYVIRMDGMLDAATEVDPLEGARLDRDALFDSIMGEIEGEAHPEPLQGDAPDRPKISVVEDDEFSIPRSPRRMAAWVMVAAAIVGAIGAAVWLQQSATFDASSPIAERELPNAESDTTTDLKPKQVPPSVTIADLEPIESAHESIRMLATPSSEVRFTGTKHEGRLNLDVGTVLVEFAPDKRDGDTFEVATDDLTVRVVGTIFYVSKEASSSVVGVVTGKVEITTRQGKSVFLTDGQEYDPEFGIRSAPETQKERVEAFIDVEGHKSRLADARTKPGRVPSGTNKPLSMKVYEKAPEVPEGSTGRAESMSVLASTLRDQATEAVRVRQYDDAAQLYEELIVELPSDHPAAMSARLDVSRLYMRQLKQPERAIPHLKRFIIDRPDDPAAPPARKTLCRILEARGETDTACEE